jgi:hypothetical protein
VVELEVTVVVELEVTVVVTVVWWWSLSISDKILLLVPLVVEPSLTAPPVHIIRCSLASHNNGTYY